MRCGGRVELGDAAHQLLKVLSLEGHVELDPFLFVHQLVPGGVVCPIAKLFHFQRHLHQHVGQEGVKPTQIKLLPGNGGAEKDGFGQPVEDG